MRLTSPPSPRIRVGVDIVGVERVARLVSQGGGILEEVFSAREQAACLGRARGSDERLAERFAAKEAVLKAAGTGVGKRMRWTDVEIVDEPGGRPRVELHGEVAAYARRRGLSALDVSLSRSGGLAHAVAVWEESECAST